MRYETTDTDDAIALTPARDASASVIWLHGLGADGADFVPLVPELRLPPSLAVRFVFPHAPVRPVTVNGGYEMRAWYDITSLTPEGRDDAAGLAESVARVQRLVREECGLGIPENRIIVAGFSQGGAVALHAGLGASQSLAGVIGLSTYLPCAARAISNGPPARAPRRILLCHGTLDTVVSLEMGTRARDALVSSGETVEWHAYPIGHELCAEEIGAIHDWLLARLG